MDGSFKLFRNLSFYRSFGRKLFTINELLYRPNRNLTVLTVPLFLQNAVTTEMNSVLVDSGLMYPGSYGSLDVNPGFSADAAIDWVLSKRQKVQDLPEGDILVINLALSGCT